MGTVIVMSAEKTQALLNATVTGGVIDASGNLILNKQDGTTVNVGNVGGTDNFRPMTNANIQFDGGDPNGVLEKVTITDDGTDSATWVNRFEYLYRDDALSPTRRTSFFNELGEFRAAPAQVDSPAARFFVKEEPTLPAAARVATAPVVELMDDRITRTSLWGLLGDGSQVVNGGLKVAYTLVLGPADSVPPNTPPGTVIVRTS